MLKGEIEILVALALNKRTFKQVVNSHTAINSPYIFSTIHSLIRRGYITNNKSTGYQLTAKGSRACSEFLLSNGALSKLARSKLLREHSAKAKDAINMIEKLGTEYDLKMDNSPN